VRIKVGVLELKTYKKEIDREAKVRGMKVARIEGASKDNVIKNERQKMDKTHGEHSWSFILTWNGSCL